MANSDQQASPAAVATQAFTSRTGPPARADNDVRYDVNATLHPDGELRGLPHTGGTRQVTDGISVAFGI
jgi:hypothetical protein